MVLKAGKWIVLLVFLGRYSNRLVRWLLLATLDWSAAVMAEELQKLLEKLEQLQMENERLRQQPQVGGLASVASSSAPEYICLERENVLNSLVKCPLAPLRWRTGLKRWRAVLGGDTCLSWTKPCLFIVI